MHITDPIADMLTRIRNANNAKHDTVDVPASNMKKAIAQILLEEGYIKNFQLIDDGTQGVIRITLKSVSYTHLDVYKRQPLTLLNPQSAASWRRTGQVVGAMAPSPMGRPTTPTNNLYIGGNPIWRKRSSAKRSA